MSKENAILKQIQACVTEIQAWMSENYLKLNESKTEIIILSRKGDAWIPEVELGDASITPVASAKSLGVSLTISWPWTNRSMPPARKPFMKLGISVELVNTLMRDLQLF